jgi:hypothetical protein
MISDSGTLQFNKLGKDKFDIFIYGLGYETRSTRIVSEVTADRVFAIQLPKTLLHAYQRNVDFAHIRKHRLISVEALVETELRSAINRKEKVRIGFDISSVNRIILMDVLLALSHQVRLLDAVEVYYCPAAYSEPDWIMPQIEQLGPINRSFASMASDPTKPLCVIFGVGIEAGLSMGIIDQLEPKLSYCFWGRSINPKFDRAVRRANFEFKFTGFNAETIDYQITDPMGAFSSLESLTYGLVKDYRVLIVPMGPKLFALLAGLLGMTYPGDVAIWRVQHSKLEAHDAKPGAFCIKVILDAALLNQFSQREASLLAASGVAISG